MACQYLRDNKLPLNVEFGRLIHSYCHRKLLVRETWTYRCMLL